MQTGDVVRGIVKKIYKSAKAWSILVISDNVETWYSYGFGKPGFSEGVTVEFSVTLNQRGDKTYVNVDTKTVKVVGEESQMPKEGAQTPSSKEPVQKKVTTVVPHKNTYWEDKAERDILVQNEIRLQASRNASIAFCTLLLGREAVKLGAKNQESQIENLMNHYTTIFYNCTKEINTPKEAVLTGSPEVYSGGENEFE